MNGGVGQFARVLTATEEEMSISKLPRANPRPAHELLTEIHSELYAAVYAGDIEAAKAKLDEMAMIDGPNSLGMRIRAAKVWS